MNKSYLIKNVTVFDGKKFTGIKDFFIGEKDLPVKSIDGTGQIISPGFIDVHTHDDLNIVYKDGKNHLSQGVTTIIGGNCGISAGVDNGEPLQGIISLGQEDSPKTGFKDYLTWLKEKKLPVAYIPFIGYHSLIIEANLKKKDPKKILEEGLDAGAYGLSVGFEYGYGRELKTHLDLQELTEIVGHRKKIISFHLKDQGKYLLSSVQMLTDLMKLTKNADIKIQISHLKHKYYQDESGNETLKKTLDLIEEYQSKGFSIFIDAYPYSASSTILKEEMVSQCAGGWDDVIPQGFKKSLGSLAKEKNIDPKIIYEEIKRANPKSLAIYKNIMREEDVWQILSKSYCFVGSDGLPGHPRGFGSFTKYIRHAVDNNLNLEETLSRITQTPANYFGIDNSNNFVLFDQKKIKDKADFYNSEAYSEGITAVFVNNLRVQ